MSIIGRQAAKGRAAGRVQPIAEPAGALALAADMGLMAGETRHINARVPALLLERAIERAGAEGVTDVVTRALAGLATASELGPWLASNRGRLAEIDPEIGALIDEL